MKKNELCSALVWLDLRSSHMGLCVGLIHLREDQKQSDVNSVFFRHMSPYVKIVKVKMGHKHKTQEGITSGEDGGV